MFDFRSFDGAYLHVTRIPHEGRPRLILSHGNGFAIDGYRAFWSLLADDFELVLFDLRNHGQSGSTSLAAHSIAAMAQDHVDVAAACRDSFGPRETIGVFHSVSAIAASLAGSQQNIWDAVVLVDPPLVSLDPAAGLVRSADSRLAQYARERQTQFESAETYASMIASGFGRHWAPGSALDMARAVTRPTSSGGVELVCPAEYEAQIYEENGRTDSFAAVGAMRDRTAILGADPDAPRALHPALISRAAAQRYNLAYASAPGASHMLQIEKPQAVADAFRGLLSALRAG